MKRFVIASVAVLLVLIVALVANAALFPDERDAARDAANDISETDGCSLTGVVVLQAQAVPTAAKVPCVVDTLVGWNDGTQQIEKGSSKLTYVTTSTEGATWTIELQPTCTPAPDATTVPDEPGAVHRKIDRIDGTIAVHQEWYTFEGGCAFYEVTIPERFDEQRLFAELDTAFHLIDRKAIDENVRVRSDGAFGLDPS